jgi:predicted amidohydrolase YtcJ
VRVQHRSGARWILNSAAIDALDLDRRSDGRIDRADRWLRERLPAPEPLDLAPLGAELAGYGVTGVTDATPYAVAADLDPIVAAATAGALPQHVTVTGGPELAAAPAPAGVRLGPVKIVLDEHALPPLPDLVAWVELAHRHERPVAVHCVTLASLVLALAALDEVGGRPGDRIEHGSVIPPDLLPALRRHHLTVVTQPGFVAERGDDYRRDVDPADQASLYPCRSLLDAGVGVAGSTDAPYSHPDPWRAVVAATTRTTSSGVVLGGDERGLSG